MTQQQVEKDFLRKAMQRDTSAFGEIIKKYQSLVYAVALQILADPATAQDITQDTFIAAFKALKDLRSEDSFPSWLHSIARNRALAWRKERGRVAPLEKAGVLQSSPHPPEVEIEADRKEGQAFEAGIRQIIFAPLAAAILAFFRMISLSLPVNWRWTEVSVCLISKSRVSVTVSICCKASPSP